MHLKKRMTFHGVEYLVVPVELWEGAKESVGIEARIPDAVEARELLDNMLAYEGSTEPEELEDDEPGKS